MVLASSCGAGHRNGAELSVGFPSRSREGIQKGWIELDRVLLEVGSGVALITVNDPDRRNAITDEISAGLRLAVNNAQNDPNVHAVVVTGAGKAFCAGADLSALGAAAEDGLRRLYDGFLAVADCTLPTVAAANGPAVGAGLNLALACDVRIAGPAALFDARFQSSAPVEA
jgi:enoyl-CoA hydratase